MQTHFTDTQLLDPQIREADAILRKCVHCGFCTATCPTYVVTGDERDSPRGRIWLMRELLETPDSVSADTGFHIDRCLGCLACTTTCPSGVDYHHLIEIGRDPPGQAGQAALYGPDDAAVAGACHPACQPVPADDPPWSAWQIMCACDAAPDQGGAGQAAEEFAWL